MDAGAVLRSSETRVEVIIIQDKVILEIEAEKAGNRHE